jgi:hypothetical protein
MKEGINYRVRLDVLILKLLMNITLLLCSYKVALNFKAENSLFRLCLPVPKGCRILKVRCSADHAGIVDEGLLQTHIIAKGSPEDVKILRRFEICMG